jgi:type I restriction enzyme S subunit
MLKFVKTWRYWVMGSEWRKVKLEDIASLSYGKMPKKELLNKGKYPVFSGYKYKGTYPEKNCIKGNIIIVARGVGGTGDVKIIKEDCYLTNLSIKLSLNNQIVENEFFYYNYLNNNLKYLDSGSAQSQITINDLKKVSINLPPLPEQKAIAHILGTLDEKIELNRRMNETLEQMAQALFKSWFVDFDPVIDKAIVAGNPIPEPLQKRAEKRKALGDKRKPLPKDIKKLFPDAFEFSEELDKWVPKGWKVGTIDNATSLIIDHRGKTPKKLGGEWSKKGYAAISAKNIKGGRIVNREQIRFVNQKLYKTWMKDELTEGDILMTSEAPMGEIYFLARDRKFCLSQRLYALRASDIISPCYLYSWLHTGIAKTDMAGRSSGTTVIGIKQSELRQVKVLLPQSIIVKEFESIIRPHYYQIFDQQNEIESLTSIRDTLLPKLISGEIRIPEAKTILREEANIDIAAEEATTYNQ